MSTPAVAVANYFAAEQLGTVGRNGDLYYASEPPQPDRCVTVYDVTGTAPSVRGPYEDPRIQIRVRDPEYGRGYARAQQLREALKEPTTRTLGDWYYTGFWLTADVTPIGQDEQNRFIFTVNFRLEREPLNRGL